jgi:hypothetical protein
VLFLLGCLPTIIPDQLAGVQHRSRKWQPRKELQRQTTNRQLAGQDCFAAQPESSAPTPKVQAGVELPGTRRWTRSRIGGKMAATQLRVEPRR